jgi:probable F420-dependent oxidoreductase
LSKSVLVKHKDASTMRIGLYAHTHGVSYRDEQNKYVKSIPATSMRLVDVAQRAERAGFHSMWFPDHVCMPLSSTSGHVVNESKTRAYEPRHEMLDPTVAMAAVAVSTERIRLGTSVLIAPYRGPLNDARQLATVDVLSNGRLWVGVGAGWLEEEFDALGVPFRERGGRTDEAIEIYKRAWCDDVVSFSGRHYRFANLSMDPKPVQKPRPPIVYGGVTAAGARRAARCCDGLYPLFLDPGADPFRYASLQDVVRRELDSQKRDPGSFFMIAATSMRVTDASDPVASRRKRPICTGTPEQVVEDFARFAAAGYSLVICALDCPSHAVDEICEQLDRAARDVLPVAVEVSSAGGWKAVV